MSNGALCMGLHVSCQLYFMMFSRCNPLTAGGGVICGIIFATRKGRVYLPRTPSPTGGGVWVFQLRRTTDHRLSCGLGFLLVVSLLKCISTGCRSPLSSICVSLSSLNCRPSMRRRLQAADTCRAKFTNIVL